MNTSGSASAKLNILTSQLEKIENQRSKQIGFESFILNSTQTAFHDIFEVYDHLRANGKPSSWGYAETFLDEHKNVIGQNSIIKGQGPSDGTFAYLKGKRFYDGIIHVDFYVRQI